MAYELHRTALPGIAASNITPPTASNGASGEVPVRSASGADRGVIPLASTNQQPRGFVVTTASYGNAVRVHDDHNVVKVVAGASIGRGAEVGIASSNGLLGPVAGASGSIVWSLGTSETAADAGEIFSLYVRPRQLSGTP